MTWEADMLWEERLQRQAEMLSNTAQGLPVPQDSKSKQASWPADKVERRKVKDLVPYAKNARTHSEEQIEQIADAIEQWGWTVPCLVDEKGGLIAGHGRILAARQLGLDPDSSGLMKCPWWSPGAGARRRSAPMCSPTTS